MEQCTYKTYIEDGITSIVFTIKKGVIGKINLETIKSFDHMFISSDNDNLYIAVDTTKDLNIDEVVKSFITDAI